MIKKILFFFSFLLAATAYAKNDYWQQEVNNLIKVQLDDVNNILNGEIHMEYKNNSADTLSFIYMHVYPNAYKNSETAFARQVLENKSTPFLFSEEKEKGWIDGLDFKVWFDEQDLDELSAADKNKSIQFEETDNIDIIKLPLSNPLLPGRKIHIYTPFQVKIPKTFSRLGHEGQAYQVSQWFPKPAVYDKNGWNPMPYLDQGEFYSEFGSYKVEITLPENYIIMGTGEMKGKEQDRIDSLSKLPLPDPHVYKSKIPESSEMLKTVIFEAEQVHDFAWFADKRWIVRKKDIYLPEKEEPITAYSCFLPEHQEAWANSLKDIETTILGYSKEIGNYPYRSVKVVEGALSAGGGMEYPTVTVIAATNNSEFVNTVIIHEVGHNWFYGILASNERRYPWMDEGINSFYEQKFTNKSSLDQLLTSGKGMEFLAYSGLAATHDLQPANLSSEEYTNTNYGIDIYGKVPLYLNWLESYVGEDTFRKAMQSYFEQWKFKHPQPEDFELIFKEHTPKDINWFFRGLSSREGVDFAIKSFKEDRDSLRVVLQNKTGFEGPVKLIFSGIDDKSQQVSFSKWTMPFVGKQIFHFPNNENGRWKSVRIDEHIPDYKLSNNSSKKSLGVGFLGGFNLKEKNKIWISPSIGYNNYDEFMGGLLFHNLTVPENKFQFAVAPMYGFKAEKLIGTGVAGYTYYPVTGVFKNIVFQVEGKSFDFYNTNLNINHFLSNRYIKIAPEAIFNFKKHTARSSVERNLSVKAYFIREEQMVFKYQEDRDVFQPFKDGFKDLFYAKINYKHENSRILNPFNYLAEVEFGNQFLKLGIEGNLKINYHIKNKGIYLRSYLGKFIDLSASSLEHKRYYLASAYTGQNDYLYDETFFSRNDAGSFWQNQTVNKEGGLKTNTALYANPLGLSSNWLWAVNAKADLPFWNLPIRLYGDFSTFSGSDILGEGESTFIYEAGFEFYVGEIASVYFPVILSESLRDYHRGIQSGRYGDLISFRLNLGSVNWLKLPSSLLKM